MMRKTEMSYPLLKRDPGVELARLVGCLIVIACHTVLGYKAKGPWDTSRLFIAMSAADGVAVFWMIAGAFLFDNADYGKLLKRSVKKVLIPMLLVGVLYLFMSRLISDGVTFRESICVPQKELIAAGENLLRWRNGVAQYGHSWYVYVYMLVILAFPALKGLVDYIDASAKRTVIYLTVTFGVLVLNDVTRNELLSCSHYSVNGFIPAAIIVTWGHVIYRNRERFNRRFMPLVCLAAFIALNLLRTMIQQNRVQPDGAGDVSIMYWYSSIGVLCAACILLSGLSLFRTRGSSPLKRTVCFLASYTFPIYLVHILVRNVFNALGFTSKLQKFILGSGNNIFGEVLYMVVIVTVIFTVTFVIAFLVWNSCIKLMNLLKKNNK